MQLPDNTALAKALEAGQTQEVSFTLMFDWQRDGNFATEYADFSDAIVEATLDAQFTGNYPTETEVNDGYAQRRLTVTVQGEVAGVNVVSLFSPFAGSYFGQIGAVNTPCYFNVTYMTEDGPVSLRQFTGYLLTAKPSRKDGTVEIELADITSQLTNGIDMPPRGRSYALASWNLNLTSSGANDTTRNEAMRMRGGQLLSWYMIDTLRKSGLYQGPPAPPESVFYATLHGGCLPEVGGMTQMPHDGRQANNPQAGVNLQLAADQPIYRDNLDPTNSDYPTSDSATDVDTPDMYPIYCWERGRFGPRMKRDVYDPAKTRITPGGNDATGKVDFMTFTGNTEYPILVNPSSSQSVRIGGGGYYEFDSSVDPKNGASVSVILGGLTSLTQDVNPQWGTFTVEVYPADNPYFYDPCTHLLLEIEVAGTSYSWNWYANGIPDGNHYVAWNVEIRSGAVPSAALKIDDTVWNNVTAGSSSGNVPSSVNITNYYYSSALGFQGDNKVIETNVVKMTQSGGAEHWGVWYQPVGSISRGLVWSDEDSQPFVKSTDIGPSSARVMWNPAIKGKAAWDLLKDIGSSDLGVIYTDEFGQINYNNWYEILQKQQDASIALLTTDDVQDINPYTTFDSVINRVSYQFRDRAFADTAIFKSDNVDQFATRSYTQALYTVSAEDVVGMLQGLVSWRPVAQGYPDTTNTKENPWGYPGATKFYRSAWMKAYSPDNWSNGFVCHNMGDIQDPALSGGQDLNVPLLGTYVNIMAYLGWWAGDTDTSHISVIVKNDNAQGGRTTRIAVDDQTPFLNLRGWQLQDLNSGSETVSASDPTSVQHFGVRLLERQATDWTTDYYTQYDLSQKLADDLSTPRPVFESLDVIGDPRRQLQDVIQIVDANSYGSIGGPIYASVVGINRKFSSSDGVTETLSLRMIKNRGGAWVLGDDDLSVLGETTILSTGA